MRYILFLLLTIINVADLFSQVAINSDNSIADSSAMLDLKSINKGLLIPRLSANEKINIIKPAVGLLIYQVDNSPGFYFNAGTPLAPVWLQLNSDAWQLSGNNIAGTNQFLGTRNNAALTLRLNNLPAGSFDPITQNIGIGGNSLSQNTSGQNNVAIGWGTLKNNTTGNNMVAIGDSALHNQLSSFAYFNTAVGSKALYSNTIGFENTAFGYAALTSNTTGGDNTGIGDGALKLNTIGQVNTATGLHALYNNVSGTYNTGYAAFALLSNISGNFNTGIGYQADVTAGNFTNATAIGNNAKVDASDKVRIGNVNVNSIGGQVSWTTFSDGRYKENIHADVPGLAFILKLRPVTYDVNLQRLNQRYNIDYTKSSSFLLNRQSGFIAQEVERAANETGYDFSGVDKPKNVDALYGLKYSEFVVPMVKAMQEQQLLIDKQAALINSLMERIEKIESLIKTK